MILRKRTVLLSALIIALFSVPINAMSQADQGEKRKPLKIEGKNVLPLRVLSRAFSNIYKGPDITGETVEENVPAFQSFYVYTKKGSTSDLETLNWYEVGTDNRGTVVGWMTSDDVFEWKQTMCLSYTHPEGRNPVLMFDKKKGLEKITKMPADLRTKEVEKLYSDINQGNIPPDFPVLTVEPKMAVDISKEFYLLPILAFDEIELNNREARILQLAAVTKSEAKARESSDIRINKDFLESAVKDSTEVDAKTLEKLAIDIVWVMDTTNSMMPYITQTVKVVEDASKRISSNPEISKSVNFGIWGYRDSMDIAGIGYNVKNYTSELQNIDQFIPTLKTVDVTSSGSQGYAEDAFSGVYGAVDQTNWTPGSIKVVVLVADAPSHEVGHKWNASGQSQGTLRTIADDRQITIFSIHLKDPKAEKYHATAEEQFQALSINKGTGDQAAYSSVASDDLPGFEQATIGVTDTIITLLEGISNIKKNDNKVAVNDQKSPLAEDVAQEEGKPTTSDFDVTIPQETPTTNSSKAAPVVISENIPVKSTEIANLDLFEETNAAVEEDAEPSSSELAKSAMKAAFVEWIGSQSGAQAPRDVVAWVTDKDMLDTDIQSLEVRLLVNKRQLDSLRETLSAILMAGRQGQISGDDFFSSLQAASATTARDPDMIKRAKSLAQTGLVPEFLAGLPYTSRIMDMNSELWGSWSIDEQDMFLADLEARIMAYETIHDGPEGWVQLNRNDDPGEFVYPITLELLP